MACLQHRFESADLLRSRPTPVKARSSQLGRVRNHVVLLLIGFSLVSYIERINLSVAAKFIASEYGITSLQIGWIFSAFLISYTIAQIPAGLLIDRFGSRLVLTVSALGWFLITVFMGLAGSFAQTAAGLVTALVVFRVILGIIEAPTYPAAASTISNWFSSKERPLPTALVQSAGYLGSAITLPLMALAAVTWGWRTAIYASAVPALVLGIWWWIAVRDTPAEHPSLGDSVPSATGDRQRVAGNPFSGLPLVVRNRNVWLLSASYFTNGYVINLMFFWFYIYLVDERGFTIASGGFVAAIPTVAAAIAAPIGAKWSEHFLLRHDPMPAHRWVIVLGGISGALTLMIGALATIPVLAVVGFVAATASRGLVESSYWSLAMEVAESRVGTVGGVMNGCNNLGGAISTAMAPVIVERFGWNGAFSLAALVLVVGAVILYGLQGQTAKRL
jgi:ACS family glucarate transporter-like MFS transporter